MTSARNLFLQPRKLAYARSHFFEKVGSAFLEILKTAAKTSYPPSCHRETSPRKTNCQKLIFTLKPKNLE